MVREHVKPQWSQPGKFRCSHAVSLVVAHCHYCCVIVIVIVVIVVIVIIVIVVIDVIVIIVVDCYGC